MIFLGCESKEKKWFSQAYYEEEHGQEYVYKEPKITSLSEISDRLYRLYSDKFGSENVKIIMDSVPVDVTELDSKIAYIQVTHVVPYFEKIELETRLTEFELNHDVRCFMFETPFTKEGKARGNPEDQWKRRTILTSRNKLLKNLKNCRRKIMVKYRFSEKLVPVHKKANCRLGQANIGAKPDRGGARRNAPARTRIGGRCPNCTDRCEKIAIALARKRMRYR